MNIMVASPKIAASTRKTDPTNESMVELYTNVRRIDENNGTAALNLKNKKDETFWIDASIIKTYLKTTQNRENLSQLRL